MHCSKCKSATEPTTEFYYPSQIKSGKFSWCKGCFYSHVKDHRHKYKEQERAYNQKRYRLGLDVDYRKRWREDRYKKLNVFKEANPCMDCSNFFPAVCMDFDHRQRATKLGDVAKLIGSNQSWEVIEAEIAKCDLICANCHRIRTAQRLKNNSESYHRSASNNNNTPLVDKATSLGL